MELRTPCYIIDEKKLIENGEILKGVQDRTGCKILLAQKAFSNYDVYPLLSQYLAGTEASGLFEARLGKEEMPEKECHVFCAAYREDEFDELLNYADHIVFNSVRQLSMFADKAKKAGKEIGLRINPEHSTQEGHEIYDPCSKTSRLGVTRKEFDRQMTPDLLEKLDGIHFHTLCEQNSDDLATTLDAVIQKFDDVLFKMKWVNMGGGHHITREDYDVDLLEKCIKKVVDKYNVTVYLEPGEAVALNAGYLKTTVLDIVANTDNNIAILDMSAACHTPDVIEMPYLPPLQNAVKEGNGKNDYILAGPTCLAGDVVGTYGFDNPLNIGDILTFEDMAIYSMCKNNTFNGMPLPSIYLQKENGDYETLASFDYFDFKYRLGRK